MTRLAVRLALADRRSVGRLAAIAAGVAVGVLVTLAALGALTAAHRSAGAAARLAEPLGPLPDGTHRFAAPNAPYTWWQASGGPGGSTARTLAGRALQVVDVAGSAPGAPVPAGLPQLPAAGQAYASPALRRFLASRQGATYRVRIADRIVGTLPRALVPSPRDLVLVRGVPLPRIVVGTVTMEHHGDSSSMSADDSVPAAQLVTSFSPPRGVRGVPSDGTGAFDPTGAGGAAAFAVLAALLLAPPLALVAAATRIGAVTRARRLAALRLAGASSRDLTRIAVAEALLGAIAGVVAALALAAAALVVLGPGPSVLGVDAWRADLVPPAWQVAGVAAAVLAFATLGSVRAARSVRISPLGLARRGGRSRAGLLRLVPGAFALVAVVVGLVVQRGDFAIGLVAALVIVVALLAAGPLLVGAAGLLLARSRRAAAMLAAARLRSDPVGAFRSGGALALGTFVAGAAAIGLGSSSAASSSTAAPAGVVAIAPQPSTAAGSVPRSADVAAAARAAGVAGPVVLTRAVPSREGQDVLVVGSCAQLRPVLGAAAAAACTRGALVPDGWAWTGPPRAAGRVSDALVDAAIVARDGLPAGYVPGGGLDVVLGRVGDQAALERVRARLEPAGAGGPAFVVRTADFARPLHVSNASTWSRRGIAGLVLLALLAIGSATLLAVDGIADRRSALAGLSALGVPAATLRRALAVEIGAGMGLTAAAGAALGMAAAAALASSASPPNSIGVDLGAAALVAATIAGTVLLAWLSALPVLGRALRDTRRLGRP